MKRDLFIVGARVPFMLEIKVTRGPRGVKKTDGTRSGSHRVPCVTVKKRPKTARELPGKAPFMNCDQGITCCTSSAFSHHISLERIHLGTMVCDVIGLHRQVRRVNLILIFVLGFEYDSTKSLPTQPCSLIWEHLGCRIVLFDTYKANKKTCLQCSDFHWLRST